MSTSSALGAATSAASSVADSKRRTDAGREKVGVVKAFAEMQVSAKTARTESLEKAMISVDLYETIAMDRREQLQ